MPESEVQGPMGLHLDIPPLETPSVASSAPAGDQMLASGRSRSQPLGESSQGPSASQRSQSESSLNAACLSVPQSTPPADNAAQEQPAAAPSPVPTEIIPPDLTQEEIVVDIQQSGVKVRDFAYEDVSTKKLAPELFDPILGWHVYESMLENPNPNRNPVTAKYVRRLLDLGWVTEEEDGHRWQKKDREALEQFDSRPHYPWKALEVVKPRKDELREAATARFQWLNSEQLAPQFVDRPASRFASIFRHATMRYQKRSHANEVIGNEEQLEISPQLKKRRLSPGAESAVPESQSGSSAPAHIPLTLVNGKPPQQFPAGRPSDIVPRPAALPTQGALSRSLQRHLSMTSLSSPCSTDLSRSDSPTTLT